MDPTSPAHNNKRVHLISTEFLFDVFGKLISASLFSHI
jgi:hypothetical protein